jgi:hypothetical protein
LKYTFSRVQIEHARSLGNQDATIARIKKQTEAIMSAPKKDRLKICNAFKHRLGCGV